MKSEPRVCIMCGEPGTTKWTISSSSDVAVVNLCVSHSEPLNVIMVKSQGAAVEEQKPWEKATPLPNRIKRGPVFEPLDWTPPEDGPGRKKK